MIIAALMFLTSAFAQQKAQLEVPVPYQFTTEQSLDIIEILESMHFPRTVDGDYQVDLVSCTENKRELGINGRRVQFPFTKKDRCDLGLKDGFNVSLQRRAKKLVYIFREVGIGAGDYEGHIWNLRDLHCDMKLKACQAYEL